MTTIKCYIFLELPISPLQILIDFIPLHSTILALAIHLNKGCFIVK